VVDLPGLRDPQPSQEPSTHPVHGPTRRPTQGSRFPRFPGSTAQTFEDCSASECLAILAGTRLSRGYARITRVTNATHVIILDRPAVFSNILAEVDPRRGTPAHLPELVEAIEALVCDLARAALKYNQQIRLLLLTRGEARGRGLLRPEQMRHGWIPHALIERRRRGDHLHCDNLARLSEEIAQMREREPRSHVAWICDTDYLCWLELWCQPLAMGRAAASPAGTAAEAAAGAATGTAASRLQWQLPTPPPALLPARQQRQLPAPPPATPPVLPSRHESSPVQPRPHASDGEAERGPWFQEDSDDSLAEEALVLCPWLIEASEPSDDGTTDAGANRIGPPPALATSAPATLATSSCRLRTWSNEAVCGCIRCKGQGDRRRHCIVRK